MSSVLKFVISRSQILFDEFIEKKSIFSGLNFSLSDNLLNPILFKSLTLLTES